MLVVLAAGLGAYFFFSIDGNNTVEKAVSTNQTETVEWNGTLYPGETTSQSFNFSNAAGSAYEVQVVLENFSDVRAEGIEQARFTTQDAYISNLSMGEEGGTQYAFTGDLLNDGNASFHVLDANTVMEGQLNVTLKKSSAVGDSLNFTVSFARAASNDYPESMKIHEDAGSCSNCHDVGVDTKVGVVHDTLLEPTDSCTDCHGMSGQDIHQNCVGCHGEYPAPQGHGFSDGASVTLPPTETCDTGGCHDDTTSFNMPGGYAGGEYIAHNMSFDGSTYYCGSCHNESNWGNPTVLNITTMHQSTTFTDQQCSDCHGLSSSAIHEEIHAWEVDRCGDCHPGY